MLALALKQYRIVPAYIYVASLTELQRKNDLLWKAIIFCDAKRQNWLFMAKLNVPKQLKTNLVPQSTKQSNLLPQTDIFHYFFYFLIGATWKEWCGANNTFYPPVLHSSGQWLYHATTQGKKGSIACMCLGRQ